MSEYCSIQELADNEILLNFKDILTDIYSNLIKIEAHCYDTWDNIAENLFFNTVMMTFYWKYELENYDVRSFQTYAEEFGDLQDNRQSYIQCNLNKDFVRVYSFGEESLMSGTDLKNKTLVFKCFGDSSNSLTGSITKIAAEKVHFNFTEVNVIDSKGKSTHQSIFINNEDLIYKFIAATK